jgi:hypothetical protein
MADESDRFCTQCGLLGMEDDADGRAVSPIDEDGSCRFCGCDTCGLDQVREHLAARGLLVVSAADKYGPCVECALDVPLSKAHTLSIWAELQLRADNPCVRTEAEQRVLDAITAVPEQWLLAGARMPEVPAHWVCRAELARREMKP